MGSPVYLLRRAGQVYPFEPPVFRSFVARGSLDPNDEVWTTAGRYQNVCAMPELAAHVPYPVVPPQWQQNAFATAPPPRAATSGIDLGSIIAGAALLAGAIGTALVVADWLSKPVANDSPVEPWKRPHVWDRDRRRCVYCGIRVALDAMHVDHRTPRVIGGSNELYNLACSCAACNLEKGTMTSGEYRRWRATA